MKVIKALLLLMMGTLLVLPVQAQKKLTAAEAKDHLGETATVCGNVGSTRYAASTKGQPTFLDLDKPYPNQISTTFTQASTDCHRATRRIRLTTCTRSTGSQVRLNREA